MSDNGKSYRAALAKVDRSQRYALEDSLRLVKETARAKFDETVELAIRLGVDPRQADQNIRGTVSLPHGMGKTVRVLAFAKGEKEKEAQDAGADFVGSDELIKKISEGWFDFDKAVATPDMMAAVGRIGKVLGPRGPDAQSQNRHGVAWISARPLKKSKLANWSFASIRPASFMCPSARPPLAPSS